MIDSIKDFISKNTGMLIRMDDIAENMNWKLMDRCEILFKKYNIKPLLGVIPSNQDKELFNYEKNENFWNRIRDWQNEGWEISMHGFSHVYDKNTNRDDYFKYGGKSEFCGHNLETQKTRIKNGIKKFNEEKIKIRSFFAPNHTYDINTFKALKEFGVNNIIDGYGLIPYTEKELNFIPQLFYKEIMLPFGIQTTQIHLNYWKDKDFNKFEGFINKHHNKIISFENALERINNGFFSNSINFFVKNLLKFLRLIR